MSHNNISIFVPHAGCPQNCSFCNQKTISGQQFVPHSDDVKKICGQAMEQIKDKQNTEIAFFGGSFTAIDHDYMTELLEAAGEFLGEDKFKGIRVSTRPDFINREILETLKKYGVTAIELGAQSMVNKVLEANDRGHTAEDVYEASRLIKEYGFELGLQMMIGLYKSTDKDEFDSIDKIVEINPDTVRIYPVVILKGTKLAELYESGDYRTFSFEEVLDICSIAMMRFEQAGIRVIKCGLHASEFVEKDMIAGFYHPAFRELCESLIYRWRMEELAAYDTSGAKSFIFAVNPSCVSKAIGHRKSNLDYFKKLDIEIKVTEESSIPKYQCEIRG